MVTECVLELCTGDLMKHNHSDIATVQKIMVFLGI